MQHSVAWQCVIDQWNGQADRLVLAWIYRGMSKGANVGNVRCEDESVRTAFEGSCFIGGRVGDDG